MNTSALIERTVQKFRAFRPIGATYTHKDDIFINGPVFREFVAKQLGDQIARYVYEEIKQEERYDLPTGSKQFRTAFYVISEQDMQEIMRDMETIYRMDDHRVESQ